MNQQEVSPKILVAPLDWGLGHATRCIPMIRELLAANCHVLIAASGKGKVLLKKEFPQIKFLELPGYNVQYASTAWGLAFKIVAQIPKLFAAIKAEKKWLEKVVAQEGVDAVISDNRYGLYHPGIRSIFVTHQLRIKAPVKWIEALLQKINYAYINQFDECWVPDAENENSLAGELSHSGFRPAVPVHYIGFLSRFDEKERGNGGEHLLIVLSGPEPQRTLLENMILKDLKEYRKPVVLVRGLPEYSEPLHLAENVSVYNHLPAADLQAKIISASMVVSRCGYSTIMDLAALQKRSILIPTPGQTEQEYLAKYLMKKNFAFCVEQKKFRLKNVLSLAASFPFALNYPSESKLKPVIHSLIESVKTKR